MEGGGISPDFWREYRLREGRFQQLTSVWKR